MSSWTKEKLAEMAWDVMAKNGGDRQAAIEAVVASTQRYSAAIWRDLGPYILSRMESDVQRHDSAPSPPAMPDLLTRTTGWKAPKNFGRNIRAERYKAWGMIPVGNSGVRKPVSDLERSDILIIVAYHETLARTNSAVAKQWKAILAQVPDGKKLGQVKLSQDSQEFLGRYEPGTEPAGQDEAAD